MLKAVGVLTPFTKKRQKPKNEMLKNNCKGKC